MKLTFNVVKQRNSNAVAEVTSFQEADDTSTANYSAQILFVLLKKISVRADFQANDSAVAMHGRSLLSILK
jgi:hypothetical protein